MANNGLRDFERRLKALPAAAKRAAKVALDTSANELVAAQRSLAPREDGTLQASIQWRQTAELTRSITAGGDTTTVAARAGDGDYDYALGQEFGTQNMPANPFFWPAFRLTKKRIRARIKRAITKGIKEAYGK
ncbi:HK97-gp10 family putative phage morphogenesis protein [Mesorhizobium sp. M1365]|uniref:HK97-gp10 family putative phage morphogenesis protein n=1 Tax=Mesorhizobium sp. M1365 TaxID=2957090 RepID=UPI0033380F60